MMTVSRNAAVVLDELTADLNVGDSRKMDRGLGYMRVHVGCLHRSGLGLHYSVAHYYGQNGDLVPDPDVVFVRPADGWSPVSFQNALAYRVVQFANHWMRNIQEPQGLSPRRSR